MFGPLRHGAASVLLVGSVVVSVTSSVAADSPGGTPPIDLARFASPQWPTGHFQAAEVSGSALVLSDGASSGTWTSAPIEPGFPFTRLVPSWNADTPGASSISVDVQVTTQSGRTSGWYHLGLWAADDTGPTRTSFPNQTDAVGHVATDTLLATDEPFTRYVMRVALDRDSPDVTSPDVRLLTAVVSDPHDLTHGTTSEPRSLEPIELPVAPLSQEVHARHYPEWGGGGEAWCSPTSTEMVIEFWGRGPTGDDLAWVDPSYSDPSVDYAARGTFDEAYRGTGNWPFNTAYASRFGLDAFVSQLTSLADAERYIRAGIPLVASIATRPNELDGFLFSSGTNGHLVVIIGFDSHGNPIVNDPAAWSNASVRRVYDRSQFERVWLRGSSGTVYVIHPLDVPLPPELPGRGS